MHTSQPAALSPTSPAPWALAAIVHEEHGVSEAPLLEFAQRLSAQGWCVRGLAQVPPQHYPSGTPRRMDLIDLETGQRYPISQHLGAGSGSCCLNPAGVAEATIALRRALGSAQRPDLIVLNRFGALEAKGSGFFDEFAAIAQAGIPAITAVATPYLPAWQAFTAGSAAALPPEAAALDAWWQTQLARRR